MIKVLIFIIFFCSNSFASELVNFTFLGTGTPRPDINKLGPSILVTYKNEEILLDIGRGATVRLAQVGNNFSSINNIYISHMHFDHLIGLPDFWLISNLWQKKTSTNIFGPKGIQEFCNNIKKAYEEDLDYRYNKKEVSQINCYDFDNHNFLSESLIKVKSFKNSHGHIENSYGLIVTVNGKTIVYSGDTTYSDNVIKSCKQCDILIHEVIAVSSILYKNNKKLRDVVDTHTNVKQLVKILNSTNPKLTILNHALLFGITEEQVIKEIQESYSGDVVFAYDLLSVDVGKEINTFNLNK